MRIAAIDQGTTSTRCLVFETGGAWSLVSSVRHGQHHPQAGYVEHDPEELLANIRLVLAAAGAVDGIALSNQGESCLAWDAVTGQPLSPVFVWQDARTAQDLAQMAPDAEPMSLSISGLPLDSYFSASKLAWALRNLPAVGQAKAAGRLRLGTTDAFFLDRLAGDFATDRATASRTGLMDLHSGDWSTDLCALHGVPVECLPPIRDVDAGFGAIDGVPVRVSIVDQQAALYGHGCRNAGDTKITFGTGAFLLTVSGNTRPTPEGLLPTVGWSKQGEATTYAVEGGVYDAGAALEWAQRIGLFDHPDELASFTGPSAIARGIAFVPALSGLAAPYWDRTAAPVFIGMDHATDKSDLARAVLEGIAMLTTGLLASSPAKGAVSIDGGLSQSPYFAQFLASASGRDIVVPPMHELTALGLADLAGIDVTGIRAGGQVFSPDGSVTKDHLDRFHDAVGRARNWR